MIAHPYRSRRIALWPHDTLRRLFEWLSLRRSHMHLMASHDDLSHRVAVIEDALRRGRLAEGRHLLDQLDNA